VSERPSGIVKSEPKNDLNTPQCFVKSEKNVYISYTYRKKITVTKQQQDSVKVKHMEYM